MADVTPIRGNKIPCADCLEPFRPTAEERVCPTCQYWAAIAEHLSATRKLIEKQKAGV